MHRKDARTFRDEQLASDERLFFFLSNRFAFTSVTSMPPKPEWGRPDNVHMYQTRLYVAGQPEQSRLDQSGGSGYIYSGASAWHVELPQAVKCRPPPGMCAFDTLT